MAPLAAPQDALPTTPHRFGGRTSAALYAILAALLLVPIFSVSVPCLGDYLNHLARIHILTSIGHSADLQRFFQDRWRLVPYYGMDVPVAALLPLVGIYAAGRIFVAACVLMPVLATATLRYALHGRIGLLPALAFLLSYNFVLALGFLNYLFSAGLAVMLLAGWIATARRPAWQRTALFGLPALLLYLAHVFAFVAYGILIGGYELGRAIRRPRPDLPTTAANLAAAASQAVLPAILAYRFRAADTFGAVHVTRYGSLSDRIGALISPVFFPGAGAPLVAGFVLMPLLGLFLLGRVRVAAAVRPALALILLASCAVPAMLLNIWGAEFRLPLVAAMVWIGAAIPPRLGRPATACVLAALFGLVAARAWTATVLLRRLDAQVTSMRQLVTNLPQGARLLVVDGPEDAPGRLATKAIIQHMSLVATIDRDAFVPILFTGTTPLQLLPSMANAASQAVGAITIDQLRDGYDRPAPPGPLPAYRDGAQQYWLGWPKKFDDVLITHFGGDVGTLPPILHRLAENDIAGLYRITIP